MNAIVKPDPMARFLPVSLEEYYKDPGVVPSLSQSAARTMVTKSPAHVWTEHPRFGNAQRKSTDAQDDGSIIHRLLLGKGATLEILEVDKYTTNASRELRDNAIAAGKIPVKAKDFAVLESAAEAIRAQLPDYGIELDGISEQPMEWFEPGDLGYIRCRGVLDHLVHRDGKPVIYDLKKITSADSKTCSRHAYEYGYDIQRAAYVSAADKLYPNHAGKIDYVIVFMEIEPPYAVVPVRPDGRMRECGDRRWQRALALWERCLAEDHWPTYVKQISQIELPGWALHEEEQIYGT